MNLASLFGALGTALGLVRALPQLVRLLRARQAHGVSVDTAATSAIVSFGWAVYGLLTGQPFVSLATGSSGLIFSAITFFALRSGRRAREFKIAPLWLFVVILTGLLAGKVGLGILLPLSVLAANLPQLWLAFKEGNLADLSLGTWLLSLTDGLVWGGYALSKGDLPILIYAVLQMTTSGLIVAARLRHRHTT
jgi:uncharacterized protein with PQ loop repeat